MDAGMAAKQHDKDEDEYDEPNQAVAATSVISAAISVVAAAPAEQKNEDDQQNEQAHRSILMGNLIESPESAIGTGGPASTRLQCNPFAQEKFRIGRMLPQRPPCRPAKSRWQGSRARASDAAKARPIGIEDESTEAIQEKR
jgi:hypothetical protein